MVTVSQLREWLAQVQEAHGDIEVKFPSLVDADNEDDDTVRVEGVSTILHRDGDADYLLICDVNTLEALL